MAVEFVDLVGTCPKTGDSLTVDYTDSGFGTPDAAVVYFAVAHATDNPRDWFWSSVGFIAGTDQALSAIVSEGNQGTSNTYRASSASHVAGVYNGGWGTRGAGSLITDGLRIVWTDTLSNNYRVIVRLIKGLTNEKVVFSQLTTTGVNDITTIGFKPHLALFHTTGNTSTTAAGSHAIYGFGAAHNDSSDTVTQWYHGFSSVDGQGTTKVSAVMRSDSCIGQVHSDAQTWKGSAQDFDANGLSINTGSDSPGNDYVAILAMQGDSADDFDIGILDTPTSTGVTSTYSTGFQPSSLMFMESMLSATNTVDTGGTDVGGFSFGVYDGTNGYACGGADEDNQGTSDSQSNYYDSGAIQLYQGDGTKKFEGDVSSFESTGFKLDFDSTDSTARKWGYVAFKDASGATCTLSVTLADVTLSSTGDVDIDGTLSVTLADVTLSSGAEVSIDAQLNEALDDLTLSSTAAVGDVVTATLDETLDGLTLSSSGVVAIDGATNVTLGDVTLSSSGTVTITGTFSATLGDVSLSSAADVLIDAQLAKTLAELTLSATGAVVTPSPEFCPTGAFADLIFGGSPFAGECVPKWEYSTDPRTATLAQTLEDVTGSLAAIHYEYFIVGRHFSQVIDPPPMFMVDDCLPTYAVRDMPPSFTVE